MANPMKHIKGKVKMDKATFVIGALLRRGFRRLLQDNDDIFTFTEDKGFLDSQFIVKGSAENIYRLLGKVRNIDD